MSTQAGPEVRHPVFAHLLAKMMADAEERGNTDHRRENLAGVAGRVIELGAGTGLNFPHYGPDVSEVTATEPEPFMRSKAEAAAAGAVVDWPAEALDAPDASYKKHVRAERGALRTIQLGADWIGISKLTGNEHVARETTLRIREAGFELERERRFRFQPAALALISASHVMGIARRAGGQAESGG